MSKYHDHRSDCPFKFAPLDVCACVEHNMLDRIKALTAENKRLGQQCEGLMRAGMNNGQALILAEAKLAKASETLRLALKYNTAMHRGASEFNKRILATLAEIEGEKG